MAPARGQEGLAEHVRFKWRGGGHMGAGWKRVGGDGEGKEGRAAADSKAQRPERAAHVREPQVLRQYGQMRLPRWPRPGGPC